MSRLYYAMLSLEVMEPVRALDKRKAVLATSPRELETQDTFPKALMSSYFILTLQDALLIDGIVAFDRTGEALITLITPPNLPALPYDNVVRIQHHLMNATYEYYRRNSMPGCTNSDAQNFNWLVSWKRCV